MDYTNYVEIINLHDILEDPSAEPTENYINSSTTYITTQYKDDYRERVIIVICSSLASVLFILFVLCYKYNRKINNIKKNIIKSISIKTKDRKSSEEKLDYEFGTTIIIDNN